MSNSIPAGSIKKAICYLYLLAFCPPDKLIDFKANTKTMRKDIADQAGIKETALAAQIWTEACQYIVAFHQATREPEVELVEALAKAAQAADKNDKNLRAFKGRMQQVVTQPGRAKPENRLHRSKGCKFCTAPCRYGYFTLVSDPQIKVLQELFAAETQRPAEEQTPLRPAYAFTMHHLSQVTGSNQGTIAFPHVVNLSYCLLLLGMAKSRMALPERQLLVFQGASRVFVQRLMEKKD